MLKFAPGKRPPAPGCRTCAAPKPWSPGRASKLYLHLHKLVTPKGVSFFDSRAHVVLEVLLFRRRQLRPGVPRPLAEAVHVRLQTLLRVGNHTCSLQERCRVSRSFSTPAAPPLSWKVSSIGANCQAPIQACSAQMLCLVKAPLLTCPPTPGLLKESTTKKVPPGFIRRPTPLRNSCIYVCTRLTSYHASRAQCLAVTVIRDVLAAL